MDFNGVDAVLEGIILPDGLGRESANLTHRNQPGVQLERNRRAENESPALDRYDFVDPVIGLASASTAIPKAPGSASKGVISRNRTPDLREIRHIANMPAELLKLGGLRLV